MSKPCIRDLADVLTGNTASLWGAFTWYYTWQGHNHWFDRVHGYKPLSRADRKFLLTLMFFQIGKELADAHH